MASLRCRTRRSAIRHDVQSLEGALPRRCPHSGSQRSRQLLQMVEASRDIRQTEGVAGIEASTRGPVLPQDGCAHEWHDS